MKGGKRSTWKKKQDTKTSKHSELEITKTRNTKKTEEESIQIKAVMEEVTEQNIGRT